MDLSRKTAIIVGILFILATVLSLVGSALTGPITGASDYLVKASTNENQVIIGALFTLGAAISIALIPAMLFPILKRYNQGVALGYFSIRILESVTLIANTICLLLLVTLSQQYVNAGSPATSYYQTSGALLQGALGWIFPLNPIIFGIGALMFYCLLYKSKLVPLWLSIWGLIGAVLVLTAGLLGMFSAFLTVLALPIAIQEMVLAAWLIVKGFNPSSIASKP